MFKNGPVSNKKLNKHVQHGAGKQGRIHNKDMFW